MQILMFGKVIWAFQMVTVTDIHAYNFMLFTALSLIGIHIKTKLMSCPVEQEKLTFDDPCRSSKLIYLVYSKRF
jgi:hypothetical protein